MEWNKETIMEAVRDFNCWQGDAVIMCDTSDGDVWTDIFCSENDWKEYHTETVKTVVAKRGILERNKKISVATLSMFLEKEVFMYQTYEDMPQEMAYMMMHYGF